jgi:hypothetical protein
MTNEDEKISTRLNDVMNLIPCPVAGCWPMHGAHSEYFYDHDAESHVLEVWPVGIEELEKNEDNGRQHAEPGLLYELAELDFTELGKEITLEHFHFSQRRSIFEIGWEEDGQHLELRVHIVPVDVAEDY